MPNQSLAALSLSLEAVEVAVAAWRPEASDFPVNMWIMGLGPGLHGNFKKVRL